LHKTLNVLFTIQQPPEPVKLKIISSNKTIIEKKESRAERRDKDRET
jgi:hypothetical protein